MPASDDFGAEQVVHVERADQPVALVDHQQLVDLVLLHQLHGLDRQRLRANGFGPGRHEAVDGGGMEVGAFLQRAAQIAVGEDAAHASGFVHYRGHPHAAAGHLDHRVHGRHAVLDARHVIAAAHDVGDVHQRLAGGWLRAKSSAEKPRALSSATASASPSARAAVVLAVGARLWGQASCSTAASRSTSAWRASAESACPVMAINFAPRRFTSGTISSSSSLEPEYEMATNTSPLSIIPRSPWLASAGCTK